MSISDQIKRRVLDGSLVEFDPSNGGPIGRPLFMTSSVAGTVCGPWPEGDDDEIDMPVVQELLAKFVNEKFMSASFKMRPPVELRRLAPPKGRPFVWELRLTNWRPQYRIFGAFAAHNVFIGTEILVRDTIIDFEPEYRRVMTEWRNLFGGLDPLESGDLNDYLSNACYVR